tara:strand:+ start:645 stop:1073 length:429 start_codon:yes stop_codon:yes gene_type:complete
MKNKLKTALILIIILIISCTKDNSTDDSINEDKDIRDEFIGNWNVNEKSSVLGQRIYEVIIAKDLFDHEGINIHNFYKVGTQHIVFSTISSTKNITVPSQDINGNLFEGTGHITDDEIDFNYFINDGNEIDTVNAIYTRESS